MKKQRSLTNFLETRIRVLQNSICVLKTVQKHGRPLGIYPIARLINLPAHVVRLSLRNLQIVGLIEPTREGAVITDKTREEMVILKTNIKELSTTLSELLEELE